MGEKYDPPAKLTGTGYFIIGNPTGECVLYREEYWSDKSCDRTELQRGELSDLENEALRCAKRDPHENPARDRVLSPDGSIDWDVLLDDAAKHARALANDGMDVDKAFQRAFDREVYHARLRQYDYFNITWDLGSIDTLGD